MNSVTINVLLFLAFRRISSVIRNRQKAKRNFSAVWNSCGPERISLRIFRFSGRSTSTEKINIRCLNIWNSVFHQRINFSKTQRWFSTSLDIRTTFGGTSRSFSSIPTDIRSWDSTVTPSLNLFDNSSRKFSNWKNIRRKEKWQAKEKFYSTDRRKRKRWWLISKTVLRMKSVGFVF